MTPVGALDLGYMQRVNMAAVLANDVCSVLGVDVPIDGMLPAPKACALVVIKAKMTHKTSSVEVEEPHLGPDEAILSFLAVAQLDRVNSGTSLKKVCY